MFDDEAQHTRFRARRALELANLVPAWQGERDPDQWAQLQDPDMQLRFPQANHGQQGLS